MEELLARHASEAALLTKNIASMAPKPRFGRAPSAEAIAAAERVAGEQRAALVARQAAEVSAFSAAPPAPVEEDGLVEEEEEEGGGLEVEGSAGVAGAINVDGGGGGGGAKLTRAERRRLKKEALAAAEEAPAGASGPTRGDLETHALQEQLRPLRLAIKRIPGDGSCLFRSIADQLTLQSGGGGAHTHGALRARTADFIRTFWEEFAPFLPYEPEDGFPSDGSGATARGAVARYCDRLASTNAWGGHPEVRSLANVLGCSIVVYREGAPPLQFHPRGEELTGDTAATRSVLRITFHAHFTANAEHYNSVVPA
jgi:hypothetical protein